MSGGAGTRLWPVSTEEEPKQFHAFASQLSLLQDTIERLSGEGFLDPLIICNERHEGIVASQFSALGRAPSGLILEPFGRNTAAVAVVAALWAQRHAQGSLILLAPADHVVGRPDLFKSIVHEATSLAEEHIVTFGISPSGPETGYGYIQSGRTLSASISTVERFVEKPDRPTAESFLAEGGYSWNAGIFLFSPARLLAEARQLCPEIVAASQEALELGECRHGALHLAPSAFSSCPSLSIDVAIMERTGIGAVARCDIGWADIGSWSELWRHGPLDQDGNNRRGDTVSIESGGSLLWSSGPSISVIGVSDLMVIATPDHLLVLPKSRAQDVKQIVQARRSGEP